MEDLEHIERLRETTMVSKGIARFNRKLQQAMDKGQAFDTVPYATIADEMMFKLLPAVKELQRDLLKKFTGVLSHGGRLAGYETAIATMRPETISYIAVRCILSRTSEGANKAHYTASNNRGASKHNIALNIGTMLMLESQWEAMREREGELAKADNRRNRIADLKRTVKHINPSTVRKWLKKLDDLEIAQWSHRERSVIGLVLLEYAISVLQGYVKFHTYTTTDTVGRKRYLIVVQLQDSIKERLDDEIDRLSSRAPWRTPMVCPPRPFSEGQQGGYLEIPSDIFKSVQYLTEGTPQPTRKVIDAINRLQNIKWRINQRVLDVAVQAIERRAAGVLPVAPPLDFPAPVDDDKWSEMSKEERGAVKAARRRVHDHNNKLEARREAMGRTMSVADDVKDYKALWFPYALDFRGRAYPLAQDLHPQGDDFTRSLLEFSEGKPLGPQGLRWLCHAAAAAYGRDKDTLDEQCQWVEDNLQRLHEVANDPLGVGYEFWCAAEEPWQFLAAAIEVEAAFNCLEDGGELVSHLPVHLDGTCNGLQHLSAMGRDPVGAKAVNLMDGPRQDIYQEVADKVRGRIEQDEPAWHDGTGNCAHNWRGKVSRKTVKRGVMTTPYGVTPSGIKTQLINDGFCDDLDGDIMANAAYMKDRMIAAIDDTIVVGKAIMAWMQNAAAQLADEGKPVRWKTPTGYVCTQGYRQHGVVTIVTLAGRSLVSVPASADVPLRKRKQVNAIAPNIVHSFDAAHMMLTVLALPEDVSLTTVHDSFGTHAADIPVLASTLRQTFVDIYSEDWLASLRKDFESSLGRYEPWMEPPRMGDFDVREVLQSTFVFF